MKHHIPITPRNEKPSTEWPHVEIQLRLIALIHFPLALIHHIIVAAGIGHGGIDFQKVAACNALELFGNPLRVAIGPRIINDQQLFHGIAS